MTEIEDMEFSFLNEEPDKVPVSVEENSSDEPVIEEKEEKPKEGIPEVKLKKVSEKKKEEPTKTKEPSEEKPKTQAKKVKEAQACSNFRLDPAGEFGTCRCGWKKKDHEKKGENKAAVLLQNLKARNSTAGEDMDMVSKGDGPCSNFRLDPAAAFGTCKCGYKRQEHAEKKKNNAQVALERLRSSNANDWRKSSADVIVDGVCTTFKLDTNATDFGVCVYCGKKKGEHGEKKKNKAAELLENLKKKNEEKNKIEDLKAEGVDVTPEETEVDELTKEETKANQPAKVQGKSGGGGCCVIS